MPWEGREGRYRIVLLPRRNAAEFAKDSEAWGRVGAAVKEPLGTIDTDQQGEYHQASSPGTR